MSVEGNDEKINKSSFLDYKEVGVDFKKKKKYLSRFMEYFFCALVWVK